MGLGWGNCIFLSPFSGIAGRSCLCLMQVTSMARLPGELKELPSSRGGSLAFSLTVRRWESELSLLSKSLDPTLFTTTSQEYAVRVQLISMARMVSVANTLPCIFASFRMTGLSVVVTVWKMSAWCSAEASLRGDAVKGFATLLQCATALGVSRLWRFQVAHLHQLREVHLLFHLPVTANFNQRVLGFCDFWSNSHLTPYCFWNFFCKRICSLSAWYSWAVSVGWTVLCSGGLCLCGGSTVQISPGSIGRQSSVCVPCPPAGSLTYPPHGNMHTDFPHQTERSTCCPGLWPPFSLPQPISFAKRLVGHIPKLLRNGTGTPALRVVLDHRNHELHHLLNPAVGSADPDGDRWRG